MGFEGVVQGDTSDYVHHLLLRAYYGTDDCGQACEEWVNAAFPEDAFDPYEGTVELSEFPTTSSSSSFSSPASPFSSPSVSFPSFCNFNYADIFTWTPGSSDYNLPEDVGFRFGEASGGFSSVSVQTHYNNPDENVGVKDSSGVRVYYTEELRPMDMGTMELGDPKVSLAGAPMFDGKSAISFGCPGSCTEELFEVLWCDVLYVQVRARDRPALGCVCSFLFRSFVRFGGLPFVCIAFLRVVIVSFVSFGYSMGEPTGGSHVIPPVFPCGLRISRRKATPT